MEASCYAEVLLPVPLDGLFTYSIPPELQSRVLPGCRVLVPWGKRHNLTGVVVHLNTSRPEAINVKPMVSLLDDQPLFQTTHIEFWSWIASYYCCTLGEVLKAALPASLLPISARDDRLYKVKSTTETMVRLTPEYATLSEMAVKSAFELVKRAPKQADILSYFLHFSYENNSRQESIGLAQSIVLKETNATTDQLQALINKGIVERYQQPIVQPEPVMIQPDNIHTLNEHQAVALEQVRKQFTTVNVCLLHGYTSSGKTELYIQLILDCLKKGQQALFLVPEIALTAQLANRLKRVFGSRLGVYHSGISESERLELWRNLKEGTGADVILGARSAIFLPYRSLGFVVVDEEHETSFKQQDPAPRYHAKNAALILASKFGAKTLLGTATPSLETYTHCLSGKYGLVELFHRHAEACLPEIKAINVQELNRKKRMKGLFSPYLLDQVKAVIGTDEQAILFQNRRGYSPIILCRQCNWIPKCPRCDVSLVYHKHNHRLNCHYCGFAQSVPDRCPVCGSKHPQMAGFGTEKIEEEVRQLIPEAKIVRLDTDVSQNIKQTTALLEDFQQGKTNVLIGTQMISRGLDFSHVKVVGILSADQLLGLPDFRANERAFHLMAQVAGRGGRSGRKGVVVIQASNPDNPVIQSVIKNDFVGFFKQEMVFRKQFGYPPYVRLIMITFKHKEAGLVRQAAMAFANLCRPFFGERLLGPDQPLVSKIRSMEIQTILLKLESGFSLIQAKSQLLKNKDLLRAQPAFRSIQVFFDVDPV